MPQACSFLIACLLIRLKVLIGQKPKDQQAYREWGYSLGHPQSDREKEQEQNIDLCCVKVGCIDPVRQTAGQDNAQQEVNYLLLNVDNVLEFLQIPHRRGP